MFRNVSKSGKRSFFYVIGKWEKFKFLFYIKLVLSTQQKKKEIRARNHELSSFEKSKHVFDRKIPKHNGLRYLLGDFIG